MGGHGGLDGGFLPVGRVIDAKRREESKRREVEGVDWGVQFDNVLARTFRRLLCSRGCLRWYALTKTSACRFSTGSHVLSLCGYPFHLIRY